MTIRIPDLVGIAVLSALLSACVVDVNYDGTAFKCSDGECPIEFECVESQCVPAGESGDGAPDDGPLSVDSSPDAGPAARGLIGTYYHDPNLLSEAFTRLDPVVDFLWDHDSPHSSMAADTFSVRWVGYVVPRYSEVYTFSTLSDDGVRLSVAGELLIDEWSTHTERLDAGDIELEANQAYAIELEYFDDVRTATVRLFWSSATEATQIVPAERLRPGAD